MEKHRRNEVMTAMRNQTLQSITHYIFDLDGCIYNGGILYPRVGELLGRIRESGKSVAFLSNNSTHSAEAIRLRLRDMGLAVEQSPILVATEWIGTYLTESYGSLRLNVVGTPALSAALEQAGHQVFPLESEEPADYIILGRDTSFSYGKLVHCVLKAEKGTQLITTNPDAYHIGEAGSKVPETGSLAVAVKAAADMQTVLSVGKPHEYPFRKLMQLLGAEAPMCAMVGDNLHTDILGGRNAGMYTVWVSHGRTLPPGFAVTPDLTIGLVDELIAYFD